MPQPFQPLTFPHPLSSPSSLQTINYAESFTVGYQCGIAGSNVTSASLVASSSTTHSFNTNQRVVGLVIESHDPVACTVTLVGPPNRNIAVPAMYLLFLMNGDDYSVGKWLTLIS